MNIGVPRERKLGERRVGITPEGVKKLTSKSHTVRIETNAGILSGFTDEQFENAGAIISSTLEDIWTKSELVVKVKEPATEEFSYFRPGLAVFSFLHAAALPEMTDALLRNNVIGIDYDLVTLDDGRLPILEPMSEIAGKLSIQSGAYCLEAVKDGAGVLLGGTRTVPPAKVVVIGAGISGSNASLVADGMGANVVVFDINQEKLANLRRKSPRIFTKQSSPEAISAELKDTHLLIGAVLIPGALAPKLVTASMIRSMPKGSVFVDICIDQGGCSETSRPTSIQDPTYVVDGVIHYCVTNMPALVPRTSTQALTSETIEWILLLAEKGIGNACLSSEPLLRSVISLDGKLTNQAIGKALNKESLSQLQAKALLEKI